MLTREKKFYTCQSCRRNNNDGSFWPIITLGGGYIYDSTAIRPRYDHSTTYVTTEGLPVRPW